MYSYVSPIPRPADKSNFHLEYVKKATHIPSGH